MKAPRISAVLRIYNGEEYLGETLRSILAQTRPADEVVIVDDGSTDGTPDVLAGFGDAIRVVVQRNSGHTMALNRAFAEARFDYIANCDADDLWEPDKLERQAEVVAAHPEVDIAFSCARSFGLFETDWARPSLTGVVPAAAMAQPLYRRNFICASSTLIRRRLYERLGPFALWRVESLPGEFVEGCCEDYDYWLRAVRARAVFYYDRSVLAHHREHGGGATFDRLRIRRATYLAHREYADVVDRQLARAVLADDLNQMGRLLADDESCRDQARQAFRCSIRRKPTPFASAWLLLLAAPSHQRAAMISRSLAVRRQLTRLAERGSLAA
jgi:glycosyltransferase involved in cell wall biosynthesis